MEAGTKITVTFIRPEGDAKESATVVPTTAEMLPLPSGYVPVRFADGGTILVHQQYISAVSA
jgi:hypothetical protein